MLIYIFLLFLSFLLLGKSSDDKKTNNKQFFSLAFVVVVFAFISSVRGDFTSDYVVYANNYLKFDGVPFKNLLKVDKHYEPLFSLLNWTLIKISDDSVWLFTICSFLILIPYSIIIRRYSVNWGLSFILLLTVGFYLPSFNVTRQVVAASICSLGVFYIYKKDFLRFCLIVVIASAFHRLSLLFLPFYFVLQIKPTAKNIILMLASVVAISYAYEYISFYIIGLFGFDYTRDSEVLGMKSGDLKSCIVYLAVSAFVIFFGKPRNQKITIDNGRLSCIIYDATLIWGALYLLSMNLQFVIRFTYYFFPFVAIALPKTLLNVRNEAARKIIIAGIILLLSYFFFNAYSGSAYNPYYTIFSIRN